ILSSVNGRAGDVFRLLAEDKAVRTSSAGRELLARLATLIGAANRKNELTAFLQALNNLPESENALSRDLVRKLAAKLPASARRQLSGSDAGAAGNILADLVRDALKTAPDQKRPVAERVAAVHMLGLMSFADVKDILPGLLTFRQPQVVQSAALETLGGFNEPAVPALLLDAWPNLSPPLRAGAVEVLLSRPPWVGAFLDAVEQGKIN